MKSGSAADAGQESRTQVAVNEEGGVRTVALSGVWTTRTVGELDAELRELETAEDGGKIRLDLSGVEKMDTAGAWIVERFLAASAARGMEIELTGPSEAVSTLLSAVHEAANENEPVPEAASGLGILGFFEAIGRAMYGARDDFLMGMNILGATIRGSQMKLGRGHGVNIAAIVHQMDRMGVGAIPVVVLMSSIVGAIVAQQGAFQLRYFGAEIFTVDLVGILVLREMGVLLTAIMIAGRSGSAITAEIGSMKMREEVDALTVIGLNPIGVLVFPRLVALVIVLPCLTIAANFAAIGGAMAVTWLYSGIPPEAFLDRMRDAIDLNTIWAGLIKAPFMAMIIGVIASVEGMKVGGSAESLGERVTASVVKSIFVVIVVDGMFAIFYAAINF
ncbi:MAG: ABC transporter permease [Hyphomicrobiales bacterium]|nr:ABC transporter permease [Hyphomicrobiales bacterium]